METGNIVPSSFILLCSLQRLIADVKRDCDTCYGNKKQLQEYWQLPLIRILINTHNWLYKLQCNLYQVLRYYGKNVGMPEQGLDSQTAELHIVVIYDLDSSLL